MTRVGQDMNVVRRHKDMAGGKMRPGCGTTLERRKKRKEESRWRSPEGGVPKED